MNAIEVKPEPRTVDMQKELILYGLMAQFEEHDQLLAAARRAYAEGYRKMDAFSPFPIDGLAEALGREGSLVPFFTLIGGVTGGLGAFFMQWYSMGRLYPINVGGRPLNSWPSFIPVTFELTILIASLSALVAMIVMNHLPEPHHPVFNVPEFNRASIDRFFICIESEDPKFDPNETRKFLEGLKPLSIAEVQDD